MVILLIPVYVLITIIILICWFLIMSLILCYGLVYTSIPYKITEKDLWKFFLLYAVIAFPIIIICYFRLVRQNFSLDVPKVYSHVITMISPIPPEDFIIFLVFFIHTLIFWLLILASIYNIIKQSFVILYIYLLQYELFRAFYGSFVDFTGNTTLFLYRRVRYFTKNTKILYISLKIWPRSFVFIEKIVFFALLPTLFIFDLVWNYGMVTKIFMVMPWYFIYSLIRAFYLFFLKLTLDNHRNFELTLRLYELK